MKIPRMVRCKWQQFRERRQKAILRIAKSHPDAQVRARAQIIVDWRVKQRSMTSSRRYFAQLRWFKKLHAASWMGESKESGLIVLVGPCATDTSVS